MKLPRVPEKVEQQQGITLLRSIGADVWVLGTRRPRGDSQGTRQTPGLPDVFAVLLGRQRQTRTVLTDDEWRARGCPVGLRYQEELQHLNGPPRRALWWECKAVGGRLRPEQKHFRACCLEAEVWHVVGPFDALIAALTEAGYLKAGSIAHYRNEAAP